MLNLKVIKLETEVIDWKFIWIVFKRGCLLLRKSNIKFSLSLIWWSWHIALKIFFYFFPRNYKLLVVIFNIAIPIAVPWLFWNESVWNGFFICYALRYAVTLNATWFVNSLAHIWGSKPYDKGINPSENFSVVLATGGEGFHNFHHTFPQDYAASELGLRFNPSKWFIDLCANLGLAYDLKTISKDTILKRRMRTGNLQHLKHHDD